MGSVDKSRAVKNTGSQSRKSPAKIWLKGMGLALVGCLSATAGAMLAFSMSSTPLQQGSSNGVFNSERTVAYKNLQLPQLDRPVNILVVGTKVLTSDVPTPEAKNLGYHALVNSFDGLTDTMLLMRFDPVNKTVTALSIPRDTKTFIAGYGDKKINEANSLGGAPLVAETVSNLLDGVEIDRYVRVNVQGIEKLIDALGGVTVYVPRDMKYNDFSQHLYINLKKGEQRLNGAQVLQFSRFRYDAYGDIGRIQRQQQLIRALVEQALKPGTLLRLPEIWSVIQAHVDTNLSLEELLALAGFASDIDRSKVQMLMLPGGFSGDGRYSVSYWLPDAGRIQQLTARYFDRGFADTELDPKNVRVAIEDTIGSPEAVRSILRDLQSAGYTRVFISDRKLEKLDRTKIIAQNGDNLTADTVKQAINTGEVLVESTGNLASDVTVQIGSDWRKTVTSER